MDTNNFLGLNNKLRKYFPKEKVIFGGSSLVGNEKEFSDIDIYIIFQSMFEFYRVTRKRVWLKQIKQELPVNVNLYLMPKIFLTVGLYEVRGIFFEKNKPKKFFKQGDPGIIYLNSLKLCLKHLVLYYIENDSQVQDKRFHDLQKNFYFLTGKHEEDLEKMETELDTMVKKIKQTFFFVDWVLYSIRFRRFFYKKFEKIILDCLLDLKRFANTESNDYIKSFCNNFKKLDKNIECENKKLCELYALINKYIFLIFVV
ncbi:MAG: nucleotidyltransferase domain-containing protein [Patescibacteria group bacterium]